MKPLPTQPFDFDAWMNLAKEDPDAFEAHRQQAIEEKLASAPPARQQRLRSLQWRIDMERRRYRNPQSACVHLFGMMWDSVYGDNGLLAYLNATTGKGPLPIAPKRKAKVLPWRGRPTDSGHAPSALDADTPSQEP